MKKQYLFFAFIFCVCVCVGGYFVYSYHFANTQASQNATQRGVASDGDDDSIFGYDKGQFEEDLRDAKNKAIALVDKATDATNIDKTVGFLRNTFKVPGSSTGTSLGLNLNYDLEVLPANPGQNVLRVDEYTFGLKLNTTTASSTIDDNTGFVNSIIAGTDAKISFARVFSNETAAFLKNEKIAINNIIWPYEPYKFPLTAKKALSMPVGLTARFEFSSEGAIGPNLGYATAIAGISAGVFLSRGDQFILDVYKINKNQIRMRVITVFKPANLNAFAVAGLNPPISGILSELVPFDVSAGFGGSGSIIKTNSIMADYVINLGDAKIQSAYNQFMKDFVFKGATGLLALLKNKKANQTAINEMLNSITKQGNITKIFQGNVESDYTSFYTKLRMKAIINFFSSEAAMITNKSKITGLNSKGSEIKFDYTNSSEFTSKSSIGSSINSNQSKNIELIYKNNQSNQPEKLSELIATINRADNNLSVSEATKMNNFMLMTFFSKPTHHAALNGKISDIIKNLKTTDGYFKAVLRFNEKSIDAFSNKPIADIENAIKNIIKAYNGSTLQIPLNFGSAFGQMRADVLAPNDKRMVLINQMQEQISNVAKNVHAAISERNASTQQEKFNNILMTDDTGTLARDILPAILLSLLDENNVEDFVSTEIYTSQAGKSYSNPFYVMGKPNEYSDTYKSFQGLNSILNFKAFDTKLLIDTNGKSLYQEN